MSTPELEDEPETVTYQLEIPKPLWMEWKATNPQTATVRDSLLAVLRESIDGEYSSYNPDDELFMLLVDPEKWQTWADTVPRSTDLDDRIRELINEDRMAARSGGYDEMEERTARLLASRIGHRTQTVRQALERDDEDTIVEQLDEIEKISNLFGE